MKRAKSQFLKIIAILVFGQNTKNQKIVHEIGDRPRFFTRSAHQAADRG